MNKCLRCYKRIWPWQKEGNSPVDGTNDRVYFHLSRCYSPTILERLWKWAWLIVLLSLIGGLIAAHFIWFLSKV